MYYKSPKLADELLINAARRPGTPGNETGIIAGNSANQLANTAYTESRAKSLALGDNALKENARQFQENLGLQKKQMDYQNGLNNTANLLGVGGVGLAVLDKNASENAFEKRTKIRQDIIKQLKDSGDKNGEFWAKLLEYQDY